MRNRPNAIALLACLFIAGIQLSCRHDGRKDNGDKKSVHPPTATAPHGVASSAASQPLFAAIDDHGLENAHRVTANVISGAQPEGDEAFQALRDMGIKTILSVDGAAPDVERAHKYGMKYVHLPITYSGVTKTQGQQIAKALKEIPGPVYLHCHHGKHRSAAAVAVACIENGTLDPEQAEAVLQTFGTGTEYKGLWAAARSARPVSNKELDAVKVDYVEVGKLPPLAEAMVNVDERWDHLKLIQKTGWSVPPSHPDLDPPHEALQLEEHFRELTRQDDVKARPKPFRDWLGESEAASKSLRDALSAKPINHADADAAMQRVGTSCAACHKSYRN